MKSVAHKIIARTLKDFGASGLRISGASTMAMNADDLAEEIADGLAAVGFIKAPTTRVCHGWIGKDGAKPCQLCGWPAQAHGVVIQR